MNITSTISVFEIIWALAASIGVVYMILLLRRAEIDRAILIQNASNGDYDLRRYVALTSILIYVGGLITQGALLAGAMIAMVLPNFSGDIHHTMQIVTNVVYISASVAGSFMAWAIYTRRVKVVHLLEQQLAKKPN